MCVRRIGAFTLAALALGAVLWAAFGPGLPGGPNRAEAQQNGRVKAGRWEFLHTEHTVVMIDTESGKTWALAARTPRAGEFAWVPITRFDNFEDYRRWVREHREEGSRDKPAFPADGFKDRKIDETKDKFERKEKFEDKKFEEKKYADKKAAQVKPRVIRVQAHSDPSGKLKVKVEDQWVPVVLGQALELTKFRAALQPYIRGQLWTEMLLEVSGDLTWATVQALHDTARAAGVRSVRMVIADVPDSARRLPIPSHTRLALLLSESPPSFLSAYRLANVSALTSLSPRPRR
jgi:hypothetical protein